MHQIKQNILEILQQLKGSGRFASIGTADFVFPGLAVEEMGEVAFPVNEIQAQALILAAQKAPFGQGRHTVYDDKVRSAREIDAAKIAFKNPAWEKLIQKILSSVKADLGLEDYTIAAHLYKLLIYKEGDFFLPHKDTEKEKGMFGSLVIGLPSSYTGGELVIHFEGATEVADFSRSADPYAINYAAFYADCDHEVKPLGTGYRVCLVYNLVQEKAGKKIALQSVQTHAARLAELLIRHQSQQNPQPAIVLLGHQYTPENFSYDALKLNDRAKAEALLQAAQKAGYYARLCLVTSYLAGAPAYSDYYDDEEDDSDAEMDEVYDDSLTIQHWAKNDLPILDDVPFEEDQLITSFALDEGEPIIKESTGYMGNYGPDLMHWYHYGAVMIWSPDVNARLLLTQNATSQLNWISYFNNTKQVTDAEATALEFMVSTGLNNDQKTNKEANYDAIADWLVNRADKTILLQLNTALLQSYFVKIDGTKWVPVFNSIPLSVTTEVFEKLTETLTLSLLEQLVAVLQEMAGNEKLYRVTEAQTDKLPHYFENVYHRTANGVKGGTLSHLFWLAKNATPDANWIREVTEILTKGLQRSYVHHVLAPLLLQVKDGSKLTDGLLQSCRDYLQQRADQQPQPPPDWSRPLPDTTRNPGEWNLLKAFLESPTEQVFDYRKNQNERAVLEDAIRHVTIDLKTETIKKGSPHTLRITKTQAAYQRQMKEWKEDVALLEKLGK